MIDDTLLEAEEKMDKAVSVAKEDFSNIRTGRVHPGIFAKVTAEYYGTQTPLNQLASFHVPEPRMARTTFPAPMRANTTIGRPLSMHRLTAVVSMTLSPRLRYSP